MTNTIPNSFAQGGFIPDLILYLSCEYCSCVLLWKGSVLSKPHSDFYTKNELPLRLALFWMSSNVCSIMGSFIAFGVLRMRGLAGREGWRWVSVPIAFISFQSDYFSQGGSSSSRAS